MSVNRHRDRDEHRWDSDQWELRRRERDSWTDIAYLIVAFVIFPSGVIPGNARVPNVTGLLYTDAVKRLAEVGFKAERGEARFHPASPKETVLEQDPRAGTRDIEGTAVTLIVSAGVNPESP